MRLTKEEAGGFYAVHKERPFFGELTEFMSSGKIIALVLEADGAIFKWRDAMGATDPKKLFPARIRHDLGTSIGTNCTHGSDAPETAAIRNRLLLRRPGTHLTHIGSIGQPRQGRSAVLRPLSSPLLLPAQLTNPAPPRPNRVYAFLLHPFEVPMLRRDFLHRTSRAAAGALLSSLRRSQSPRWPSRHSQANFRQPTPSPWATSGIKTSRLAMGTGTVGAGHHSHQTALGMDGLPRLLLNGYDNGLPLLRRR